MNRSRIAAAAVGVVTAVLSMVVWQSDPAASTSSAGGADLFMRKGCAACHTGPQSTARMPVAPSLADVASWAGQRKPGVSATAYLTESILNPPAFISPAFTQNGPTSMPSLDLTDEEVDSLVAYLLETP